MTSFIDELREDWIKEKEKLNDIDPEKERELYKEHLNRLTEMEKRLTELAKTEIEVEEKAAAIDIEEQLKRDQMEVDAKDRKTRNRIDIAKIGVPTVAAFAMGLISMVWEKTDTMTSTAGKQSWRDTIRFR